MLSNQENKYKMFKTKQIFQINIKKIEFQSLIYLKYLLILEYEMLRKVKQLLNIKLMKTIMVTRWMIVKNKEEEL